MEDKILITGTGRSGTTILVKLLSRLGLDTGYQMLDDEGIEFRINQNSRGGLENYLDADTGNPLICKAPQFWDQLPALNKRFNIKTVFVPMRDLELTAKSRAKHGHRPGGLWGAHDVNSQMNHNAKVIYQITIDCARHDIPLTFIDFDRFTNDLAYAYNMYAEFAGLDNSVPTTIEKFGTVYNQVIDHSKITTK